MFGYKNINTKTHFPHFLIAFSKQNEKIQYNHLSSFFQNFIDVTQWKKYCKNAISSKKIETVKFGIFTHILAKFED